MKIGCDCGKKTADVSFIPLDSRSYLTPLMTTGGESSSSLKVERQSVQSSAPVQIFIGSVSVFGLYILYKLIK